MRKENRIYLGDNLKILKKMPSEAIDLCYIDPPFNGGKKRSLTTIKTVRDTVGDRIGFGNHRYTTLEGKTISFEDSFSSFIDFLFPRLQEIHRVLKKNGSLFVHLDQREVHYVKVVLDGLFGRECFQNEIIWAYDYGGRSKSKWSVKHNTILWYSKHSKKYTFNYNQIHRIPYMAPALVGAEKAARGKTLTSVWWHTIVPTNGKERTGYPTQKPLRMLEWIVQVHSNPKDRVLDAFCGSGTTGEAAAKFGREFILIDQSNEAVDISTRRLEKYKPTVIKIK